MSLPGRRYELHIVGWQTDKRVGWRAVCEVVDLARVPAGWHRATAEERARAVVLRGSYERCAALVWPR